MSKISELSDGGAIQGGDTLIAVRSGGNVKVTYGGSTTANIDGGTIDGTVIGGTTAAAGTFTTGQFNTSLNVDGTVTADGLTVSGTTNTPTVFESSAAASYVQFKDSGTTVDNNNRIGSNGNTLTLWSGGSKAVTIDASQRVGIGNTTPATALDVTGTVTADGLTVDAPTGNPTITLQGDAANYTSIFNINGSGNGGGVINSDGATADNLRIQVNSTNVALFSSGGDISFYEDTGTTAKFFWDASAESLGIGTSRGLLHVGTGDIEDNGSTIDFNGARPLSFSQAGTEGMRLDSSGHFLVGGSAATVSVSGVRLANPLSTSSRWSIGSSTASTTLIQFLNGAGVQGYIGIEPSSTTYATSSDERLKENITDANDAGDKIDAIKVRQYDWKADGSHQDYGMVAQELMTVAPEAVSGDPESDDMMGVDYSKLVPMLIKEVQSLRARVAQLEGAN